MRKTITLVVLLAFTSLLLSGCAGSALGKMQHGKPIIFQPNQPNQNHEYEHEDNGKHKGEHKNKKKNDKHEHEDD